jgi:uncharacterized membrane protein
MGHGLKVLLILIPLFLLIDFLWLGVLMAGFYKTELGPLARIVDGALRPVLWAAAVVYVLIPLGLVLFVLPKVSTEASLLSALGWGFVYGIVLYAVYEFTNYSLLQRWPLRMALVDIVWGGVICSVVSAVAVLIDRWVS